MTPDELDDKAIRYILNNIDDRQLSKWELGFIESITERFESGLLLTERQKEVLGEIWEKQP